MTFDEWFKAFVETTTGTPIELSDIKEAWEAGHRAGWESGYEAGWYLK